MASKLDQIDRRPAARRRHWTPTPWPPGTSSLPRHCWTGCPDDRGCCWWGPVGSAGDMPRSSPGTGVKLGWGRRPGRRTAEALAVERGVRRRRDRGSARPQPRTPSTSAATFATANPAGPRWTGPADLRRKPIDSTCPRRRTSAAGWRRRASSPAPGTTGAARRTAACTALLGDRSRRRSGGPLARQAPTRHLGQQSDRPAVRSWTAHPRPRPRPRPSGRRPEEVHAAGARLYQPPTRVGTTSTTHGRHRPVGSGGRHVRGNLLLATKHRPSLTTFSHGLAMEVSGGRLAVDSGNGREEYAVVEDPRVTFDREFIEAVRGSGRARVRRTSRRWSPAASPTRSRSPHARGGRSGSAANRHRGPRMRRRNLVVLAPGKVVLRGRGAARLPPEGAAADPQPRGCPPGPS